MEENGAPDLPLTRAALELWRENRREFTLRLEGRSMVPLAIPGDRVTVQPLPPGPPGCGEVIALQLGEALVVHRFLMERTAGDGRPRYCQKGDNSPAWSWVPPESLLGRVTVISGPERRLDLTARPWSWINPLAGRLARIDMLLPRLGRLLTVILVRFGLRLSK